MERPTLVAKINLHIDDQQQHPNGIFFGRRQPNRFGLGGDG
jgi:hypothetical protein